MKSETLCALKSYGIRGYPSTAWIPNWGGSIFSVICRTNFDHYCCGSGDSKYWHPPTYIYD